LPLQQFVESAIREKIEGRKLLEQQSKKKEQFTSSLPRAMSPTAQQCLGKKQGSSDKKR